MKNTQNGWSEWIPLSWQNVASVPGHSFGVYRFRVLYPAGKPFAFRRPLGADPRGLFYIGAAGIRGLDTPFAIQGRLRKHLQVIDKLKGQTPTGLEKDRRSDQYCRFVVSGFEERNTTYRLQ